MFLAIGPLKKLPVNSLAAILHYKYQYVYSYRIGIWRLHMVGSMLGQQS